MSHSLGQLGVGAALCLAVGGCGSSTGLAAQPPDGDVPRLATVRCTELGTMVEPLRIAAAADGVHLSVTNETSDAGTYLTYASGGDPAPSTPTERVLTDAPGEYELSCAHGPDLTADEVITLEVVDPDGFYDDIDPQSVLGCTFHGIGAGPTAEGTTGRTAADAWAAAYAPGTTLTPAPGYREDPQRRYLLRSQSRRGMVEVSATDEGGFTAGLGDFCW